MVKLQSHNLNCLYLMIKYHNEIMLTRSLVMFFFLSSAFIIYELFFQGITMCDIGIVRIMNYIFLNVLVRKYPRTLLVYMNGNGDNNHSNKGTNFQNCNGLCQPLIFTNELYPHSCYQYKKIQKFLQTVLEKKIYINCYHYL